MSVWCTPILTHTALRAHVCDACDQPIGMGTRYQCWCCVEDEVWTRVRCHIACLSLLYRYGEPDGEYYAVSPGELRESLLWHAPTREECIQVGGEDAGRVWDLILGSPRDLTPPPRRSEGEPDA